MGRITQKEVKTWFEDRPSLPAWKSGDRDHPSKLISCFYLGLSAETDGSGSDGEGVAFYQDQEKGYEDIVWISLLPCHETLLWREEHIYALVEKYNEARVKVGLPCLKF